MVQECGVGLVTIRQQGESLAFAAPPLRHQQPAGRIDDVARLPAAWAWRGSDIVHHAWCDNGPNWRGVMLRSSAQVLALKLDASILARSGRGRGGPNCKKRSLRATWQSRRGHWHRRGRHRV